jgi:(E)-4-hydroxy-3-methylbut-2-enyl-diphosphate synthase
MNDMGADYIYSGKDPVPYMLPNGLKEILDYSVWLKQYDQDNKFPMLTVGAWAEAGELHPKLNFLQMHVTDLDAIPQLKDRTDVVIVLTTHFDNALLSLRRFFIELINQGVELPVVIKRSFPHATDEELMIYAATDMGGLLIDGLGDGVMLATKNAKQVKFHNETLFGILQAARTRITKTEYISCPSCGRTLFDLQETTAMIRKRTDHLKGVKIGIMGCIVNGPGEMADADFGYVGSGKGKITLYKGKEVVKRGVPSEKALDELIELIKENGRWIEP